MSASPLSPHSLPSPLPWTGMGEGTPRPQAPPTRQGWGSVIRSKQEPSDQTGPRGTLIVTSVPQMLTPHDALGTGDPGSTKLVHSLIHSFIHSSNKRLLSIYSCRAPGSAPGM